MGGSAAKKSDQKPLNLALQGGGAHGAFTWGVLDRLLEDERITVEAITGSSAGAMNGALFAFGMMKGDRENTRELLEKFWKKVSIASAFLPLQPTMLDKMIGNMDMTFSPSFMAMDYLTRTFSPYQLNVLDLNPLKDVLEETINFASLRKNGSIKLFVNATNVRTGKIKVFEGHELTVNMLLASACLPVIFKTVEVDGECYWDGGYSGNPALYPIFYHCACQDIALVQINPLSIPETPTMAHEILDRVNEISFNQSLMHEIRAIEFVKKLLHQGKLPKEQYHDIRLHVIEASDIMNGLGKASKLNADWEFLKHLRDVGRQATEDWLIANYSKIGEETSIDVDELFLEKK